MEHIGDSTDKSLIRKRRKKFFAMIIGLMIGMLPTVNALAATITFNSDGSTESTTAAVGDTIKWEHTSSGGMKVIYTTPTGNQTKECGHTDSDKIKVNVIDCGITNLDHWSVKTNGTIVDNVITIYLSYVLKPAPAPPAPSAPAILPEEDKEEPQAEKVPVDEDKEEDKEDEYVNKHNPDALNARYYLNGLLNSNYILGKTEQSPLGQMAFNLARPQGWRKAFSMSMSYKGKNEYSLKDGTIVLYVPEEYQRTNRKYAIMAIDKNGNVKILEDTDSSQYLVTVSPRLEGYAYELIYLDHD